MADKPPTTIGYAEYKSVAALSGLPTRWHGMAHATNSRQANPYLRSTRVAKEKRERKFRIRLPKLFRRGKKQER